MAQSKLPYVYKPLSKQSSIRIIELFPGDKSAESLNIELLHADREDILACRGEIEGYEAVSYCWEGQTPTEVIYCDDHELRATRNVRIILEHLRKRHALRYLWIDAVCLDQQNQSEKGTQVPLMGKIFRYAKKVHIWLGEPQAEDRIPKLFASFRAVGISEKVLNEPEDQWLDRIHNEFKLICGDDCEAQIIRFFSREWFSRRWILQECAMNMVVVVRCGEDKIAWSWFLKVISPILSLSSQGRLKLTQEALNALEVLRETPEALNATLLELPWAFPESECSEAKDRIFALLGMAIDLSEFENKPENKLDYADDWSKTFAKVARTYFQSQGLQVFRHLACFGSISQPDLPSWVPDWRAPQTHFMFAGGGYGLSEPVAMESDQKIVFTGWYRGAIQWTDDSTSDPASRLASCMSMVQATDAAGLLGKLLWVATEDLEHDAESLIADEDLHTNEGLITEEGLGINDDLSVDDDLSIEDRSKAMNLRTSVESAIYIILNSRENLGNNETLSNSISELFNATLGQFSFFFIDNSW